jgi:hypothetical protein
VALPAIWTDVRHVGRRGHDQHHRRRASIPVDAGCEAVGLRLSEEPDLGAKTRSDRQPFGEERAAGSLVRSRAPLGPGHLGTAK